MSVIDVQKKLADVIKKVYGITIRPEITYPEPKFGDLSTNVAFILARQLKTAPRTIADNLAQEIIDHPIVAAEAAGGGYINFTLSDDYWAEQLKGINKDYGHTKEGKGQKVQVEFISANPTGPLTLGNARGGFLGDVVGNLLASQGYGVTKEYYFNDAGTQIKKLVESVMVATGEIEAEDVQYQGEYIQELARTYKTQLAAASEAKRAEILTNANFESFIQDAIERMGIHFDEWFNEKDLVSSGQFDEAMGFLRDRSLVYEKDGATWLASSKYGDERDRVLLKSSGDITYLGNDIAYHLNIFQKRSFSRAIKLWGADHAGQIPSLKLTMKELLPDKTLEFIIIQWVRLMKNGQEVKMSKRAGTFVTVQDLLDELGAAVGPENAAAVARWFFLMRSADSQMDFDLDLAREQSQKNPLFYVFYSYVRAQSILRQAAERGLKPAAKASGVEFSSPERELIRNLSKFPELISQTSLDYGVHRLTFFGYELARIFHDLYESERIIELPAEAASRKLLTIDKYVKFMQGYFALLGITPPAKM